jgi:Est1 DNA/RNA binding domain
MWKHGIHEFLEILRHKLPHSREFMVQFIYHAYHVVCLLLETVPAFKDTWVECLGDLSRCKMATEDEDLKDKEIWVAVARYWYCQAVDRMPNVGRLYHHLAILARPNALQMLYLYNRSMMSARPFARARDSIQTLLDPVMRGEATHIPENKAVDLDKRKAVNVWRAMIGLYRAWRNFYYHTLLGTINFV